MWAIRICHESSLYDDQHGSSFVTLTYRSLEECSPEQAEKRLYCPEDMSLKKSHFQKFMRRVRKHYPQRIRYFHCGEYGALGRPHYHACLFNLAFTDDRYIWKDNGDYPLYRSPTLEKLWPYGYSTIGELNFDTAAYTASYTLKKVTGKNADEHYMRWHPETGEVYWLQPEYVTMSLKPGIGQNFYEKFKDDIWPHDEVPVPGKGIVQKVPRYYQKLLEVENPDMLEHVQKVRQQFIQAHGGDYTPERLYDRYKVAKKKQSLKERTVE